MDLDLRQSLDYAAPELSLAIAAVVVALLGRFPRLEQRGLGELALFGASVSVLMAARLSGWGEVWAFERLFVVDGLAIFCKIVIGFAAVAALWIWLESAPGSREGELGALVLLVALALDLMASAAHLASLLISVELAGFAVDRLCRPAARGVPYTASLAAAAAALVTLGAVAWLWGFAGDPDYERIRASLVTSGSSLPPFAVACASLVALSPALRAFGATSARAAHVRLPLAALLSVGLACAGLGACVRWLLATLSNPGVQGRWIAPSGADWSFWLAMAAAMALLLGGLAALRERSLSRLLAAGAVAQLGLALLGAAAMSEGGLRATLGQVAVASLAMLGAFHAAALVLRGSDRDSLDACHGFLGEAKSVAGVTFAIFLLSLAGVPPLAGFFARLELVRSLVAVGKSGLAWMAIAGSVVMIAAYGRVLRALYAPGDRPIPGLRFYDLVLSGLLAVAVVLLGVIPGPLVAVLARSIHFLPQ